MAAISTETTDEEAPDLRWVVTRSFKECKMYNTDRVLLTATGDAEIDMCAKLEWWTGAQVCDTYRLGAQDHVHPELEGLLELGSVVVLLEQLRIEPEQLPAREWPQGAWPWLVRNSDEPPDMFNIMTVDIDGRAHVRLARQVISWEIDTVVDTGDDSD